MKNRYRLLVAALLVLQVGALDALMAQRRSGPPPERREARDPLARLKRALADAGAAPLSASQEQQITALIEARRTAARNQTQNSILTTARQAYDTAILNGSLGAAEAQADIMATDLGNNLRTQLKATAKFQIDVLNVLRSNPEQFNLLSARIGAAGLTQLLASLAGGPGGPGGFPGPGPGPGRQGSRGRGDR